MAALKVSGEIRVPGDKSISHRSLMLAALSTGTSSIRGVLQSADVDSTAGVLRSLGVAVPKLSSETKITGVGFRGMQTSGWDLDCGNSGTTARLMAGIVAGQPIQARFVGDASLSARPMQRIAEPLTAMGAVVRFERPDGDGLAMTVLGAQLRTIEWDTPVASAQIKSAILLAALVSGVEVTVREPGGEGGGTASRDHTERMLGALGVSIETRGSVIRLRPVAKLRALDATVPGDPSSAAFFVALAALAGSGELLLPGVCTNPTRSGFFRVLARMGAQLQIENPSSEMGEDVGTLLARPASLRSAEILPEEVPSLIDELPILACLAAGAGVALEVRGAAELRHKESDRIHAIVSNLLAVGARARERPDGFNVRGERKPLQGRVITRGDHRIAMAFGILGKLPGNEITVDDHSCVGVSYPHFWTDLERAVA